MDRQSNAFESSLVEDNLGIGGLEILAVFIFLLALIIFIIAVIIPWIA